MSQKRDSDRIEKHLNSVESDQRVIDAKLSQANNFMSNLTDKMNDLTNQSISSQNELRAKQMKNDSKFRNLSESQGEMNVQLCELCKDMKVFSSQNVKFQNDLISAQNDIKSNMADTKSDSIATKQRVEQLENCMKLLTEKLEKTS